MYVARTRNGFVPATRRQVFQKIRGLFSEKMPFVNLQDKHGSRWGEALTTPLSLTGKYQLVILAAEGDPLMSDRTTRLDRALVLAFSQLGVNAKKFLVRVMSGAHGSGNCTTSQADGRQQKRP